VECKPLSKQRRLHGLLSIVLLDTANLVALVALFLTSPIQGAIFLFCYIGGAVLIVYSYCCKCSCREHGCAHVVPGLFASALPRRRPGKYTGTDLMGVALPVTVLLIFPQSALMSFGWPFYLYWGLVSAGILDIVMFVCPRCDNKRCLVKGGHGGQGEESETE